MKILPATIPCLALALSSFAAEEPPKLDFRGPLFGDLLAPVEAQEGADFHVGFFSFGLWQRDSNTLSSKFLEYRDVPNGAVAPLFRFQGKKGDYRYDLIGHDVTQKDQQFAGRLEGESWKLELDYTGIPHGFGNAGKSILEPVNETDWRLSDTLQQSYRDQVAALTPPARSYENLAAIVAPTLDAKPPAIDIALQRNRTNLAFSLLPGSRKNFDIGVTYFHERRSGSRTNHGTAFGFSNVVETADPIRYITQDFGLNATTQGKWGTAFAALHLNDFSNRFERFSFDNPFRAVDSTDPIAIAYLAPGAASINGPASGLLALPSSNEAWNVSGGGTLKLGPRARLFRRPPVRAVEAERDRLHSLHVQHLDFHSLGSARHRRRASRVLARREDRRFRHQRVLHHPGNRRHPVQRPLRLYQNDNKTPRIRFEEGYVRFDAVWEEIPRISVPYGFDSNYLDVYGRFDAGRVVGFEVGYKWNRIERVFRESQHTSENTLRAAADLKLGGGVLVRGLYELGRREFDEYDAIHGEEASFLEEGPPANLTLLRRYDQANRDRNRLGAQLQWSPDSAIVTVSAAYYLNRDDYDDSPVACAGATPADLAFCPGGVQTALGLIKAEYETFNLDVDVSPSDRATLYGVYSSEDLFNYQTGRQSGATINFNPTSNWSSTVDNKVDTIGGGANFTLVPEKWSLEIFYRFQKVDGNNAIEAGPAIRSASNPALSIAEYDDTEIHFVSSQVRYQLTRDWTFGVGAFWEDYELRDTQTGQVLFYMPGSFFINANNADYQAWVGWINLSYRF